MKTVSLSIAKQLKEAGYPQISDFYWSGYGSSKMGIVPKSVIPSGDKYQPLAREYDYAAPTADEILERLPSSIFDNKTRNNTPLRILRGREDWAIEYHVVFEAPFKSISDNSLADAAAKMWLYLKQENLI